jgi:hypothetical protein
MVLNAQRKNLTTPKKHLNTFGFKTQSYCFVIFNIKKILNTQKYFKYFSMNSPDFHRYLATLLLSIINYYDSNDLQVLFYSKSYDYVPLPLPTVTVLGPTLPTVTFFGATLPNVTQRDINVTDRYRPVLTVT